MEKKFWWFSKKNDSASDFDEVNNGYYDNDLGESNDTDESSSYDYSDGDVSDVSVVLSGDPSKEEPLMKKTFTPDSCEDSADIVDAYKQGRVIVICVEELDKPNFMRLFDYLMGAVQALDGELARIDRDTVVLLPYGVNEEDISIDELEEDVTSDDEDEEEIAEDEDIEDEDDEDLE